MAPAQLVHVAFMDDASHFVASTAAGSHVFSCNSLKRMLHKPEFTGAEVASAGLLGPSMPNSLAVVTRRRPSNKSGGVEEEGRPVVHDYAIHHWVWGQTNGGKPLVLNPSGAVRGVRLLGDHMLVAGEEKAALYDVHGHREKEVCRRGRPGSVVEVRAHGAAVSCLALSPDARLLATASSRGTLVRIFSTADRAKLQELRRGSDRADIHCIAFSSDSKCLAVSSDKATVHVFPVTVNGIASSMPEDDGVLLPPVPSVPSPAPAKANEGSSRLSFLKGYLPSYFGPKRSLAQFRLPEGTKYLVAFPPQHQHPCNVLIVGMDGSFSRCVFDPVEGGATQQG
ncbi:autophagy-related protein 18a-like [Brachypodium distachyon]|uniref:autophagy-related protein 18a-like n=1 Tax=Brachypodium distachyon TaxID=15368 RepID=UPI000D0DCA1C|nr:autophagy-related protein 18a-like [Brachypodium distachyon]|eukprot:XP_024311839.1 autophagy-related protein 18a-like [Brachypodium distachyon]